LRKSLGGMVAAEIRGVADEGVGLRTPTVGEAENLVEGNYVTFFNTQLRTCVLR